MSQIDPSAFTLRDLCTMALEDGGVLGLGQQMSQSYFLAAQSRLQLMLQEWNRKRWFVWHLVSLSKVANGSQSYTCGPGGDFDTGTGNPRPARIESAFMRQLNTQAPNQPDTSLVVLKSREDYDKVRLKQLQSFSYGIWMDTSWPLARVYPLPIPQANLYEVFISVMMTLPQSFAAPDTVINMPWEYFNALELNLALRLRQRYRIPGFPGDTLPGNAKAALNTIKTANTQIAELAMPATLIRAGIYNILGDGYY